jgi:hypothetical protein
MLFAEMTNLAKAVLGDENLAIITDADEEESFRKMDAAALFLATAGYVDEGNDLLRHMWSFGFRELTERTIPNWEMLWVATGRRPEQAWHPHLDLDDVHYWHRRSTLRFLIEQGRPGAELLENAFGLLHPGSKRELVSLPERIEALNLFRRFLDLYLHPAVYISSSVAIMAADLAAECGLNAESAQFVRLWAQLSNSPYWRFQEASSFIHVAPLLVTGVLKEFVALSQADVESATDRWKNRITERYTVGRSDDAISTLAWIDLLATLSAESLRLHHDFHESLNPGASYLGFQPASEADVRSAEERLNLQLPADYRSFLLASNGFRNISFTDVPLLPIESVTFVGLAELGLSESPDQYYSLELIENSKRALLISGQGESTEIVCLLVPRIATEPWRVWSWSHWNPEGSYYSSFRIFVESRLSLLPA